MPSEGGTAVHASQQYPSSPTSITLPPSLISSRPILPLPKRRVPSTTSSSSTTNSTTALPLPPPQIFTHTYPPASSRSSPPYVQPPGDFESSDSEDDADDAGSTASSVGREDFNLKNKKKRKIPLSATSSGNVNNTVTDMGSPTTSIGRVGSMKGRLSGWRVPSATSRNEGGYLRRKTRVSSRSVSVEPQPQNEVENESVDESKTSTEKDQSTEEISTTTPTEGIGLASSFPFSFSCPSPLTLPIIPSVPPNISGNNAYSSHPSAPPTAPLPVPPPPPPAGQENISPQEPYPQTQPAQQPQQAQQQQQPPPQQQQQQRLPPQGIKHPNSEKARRVAQLTKLRERYRTGPKPETDEIYICQFCTYGFIYGEDPIYLVRQYNRKRNAEIRSRRERRKMLEKARMKGKKGPLPATNPNNAVQTSGAATVVSTETKENEFEDDGLCCTCGQQVGKHNHAPPSGGGTTTGQGGQGHGPRKGK